MQVDMRQVERLENDLRLFKDRALPFATKATVNRAAFETRTLSQQTIRQDMTNRNKFTERSVRVEQTRTLDIKNQEAIVGSIADYMAVQEFGGDKSDPSIATGYSAGQEGARPRTRLPRKPNKMANIQLKGRRTKSKGRTRSQQNFVAVKQARKQGQKYVYMKGRTFEGLFRVLGGKVKMVHDLSRKTVAIPKSPWLLPATERVTPQLDRFYADALRFQLRRAGLLGY